MKSLLRTLLVGSVIAIGAVNPASAAGGPDAAVVGVWTLNLAKSKFSGDHAPKSLTRTYVATADGMDMTIAGVAADGKPILQHAVYRYDGKAYPVTGAAEYDTVTVHRIDSERTQSTQRKAGTVVSKSVRVLSKDGRVLTISSTGTDAKGKQYYDSAVFDRKQ